ncbi:MAG: hypothetical protein ACRYG7_10335 [Janthinobacterium lividum]
MVAIAKPIPQAANDLQALTPTAQAAALGYPSTLQGYTPDQSQYWREPGLPLVTHEVWLNAPLGYTSTKLIWCRAELGSNDMAPRFPKGCVVNVAPVLERKNLVIGKVYLYVYLDTETGEEASQMGRLEKIGGNCLWARADNDPKVGLCWLLLDDERKAVWNVHEVTHYFSYSAES